MVNSNRSKDSALLAQRATQVQRGGARAAVLGINDGLVSVLCIGLGVAGAKAAPKAVLLAGFAGLVAGAISMAAGEWISVTSQVELFNGVLSDLKKMVKTDRKLFIDQLEKDFLGRGVETKTATNVIQINSNELGSPWTAAISSLLLFTAGALAALIPWFFTHGSAAIILSILFTALGGLAVGGYVTRASGNSIIKGALCQLLIIILAAVVTYGIGYVFGTSLRELMNE